MRVVNRARMRRNMIVGVDVAFVGVVGVVSKGSCLWTDAVDGQRTANDVFADQR